MASLSPPAYREFLLSYNGGRPQPARFAVPARSLKPPREAQVEWFLGITGGIVADNDLEEHRELIKPIFPDLFPIAWDTEWKLILIGLGGDWVRDAIYYYDNEEMLREDVVPLPRDMLLLAWKSASFLMELY